MSEIIKKQAPIVLAEIKKANSILLHCHPSPDPDSVGSSLAMMLALEQLGKKVTLIQGDDEIPKAFAFPGVERIVKKTFTEIDFKDFDLFLILDSGGLNRVSVTPLVFPESLMTIVIDHHSSNQGFGKINLIEPTYKATAQMLFDLFREIGVKIDHDIAANLFIGIYTDTGGFRYTDGDPTVLKLAAELAVIAPDYAKIIDTMENSRSKEALVFEGMAITSMKSFFDGKLIIASVTYDELKKNNIKKSDVAGGNISNKFKSIEGVQVSAILIEHEPGIVKMSLRGRDGASYNVAELAMRIDAGGGGHKAASGVRVSMTMPEAIDKVVKTAKELYNL